MSTEEATTKLDGVASVSTAELGLFEVESTELHRMREARVAWKIGEASGGGLWFPAAYRPELMRVAVDACNRYGKGTHWIEERDA